MFLAFVGLMLWIGERPRYITGLVLIIMSFGGCPEGCYHC